MELNKAFQLISSYNCNFQLRVQDFFFFMFILLPAGDNNDCL